MLSKHERTREAFRTARKIISPLARTLARSAGPDTQCRVRLKIADDQGLTSDSQSRSGRHARDSSGHTLRKPDQVCG